MTLDIQDQDHMDSIVAFAKHMGLEQHLNDKLTWLGNYSDRETKCRLWKDFAPHSFQFEMLLISDGEEHFWFNGGLIYHGPGSPGDGSFPTLSVDLSSDTKPHWSIHT